MSQPWTHSAGSAVAYQRPNEWYVEPAWCSKRLFEEEKFEGKIYDPCCGMGSIVINAIIAGYDAYGSDITNRGWDSTDQDFYLHRSRHNNFVFNPPFNEMEKFATHALTLATRKVAMIMPTARLNAARWLEQTPLRRIWLLTPRPSMPPGQYILDGGKVGGGKSDYCWLVWEVGYSGAPELRWLRRDGGQNVRQANSNRGVARVR